MFPCNFWMKALAKTRLLTIQMETSEDIVGIGENVDYKYFPPFPLCFPQKTNSQIF